MTLKTISSNSNKQKNDIPPSPKLMMSETPKPVNKIEVDSSLIKMFKSL